MSTSGTEEFFLGSDNQYRIGKFLGKGTFGEVRLGVHLPTEQKVAVKTLQKEKIIEQADIERVTREICILKILRHPNIIQLYEIIETATDIHLIMEYAEGGELFDYIVSRRRLDETEAVTFMQQILMGVEYMHKNGIVHRDLKPQNLLLDSKNNIKIVDFGLSNQYKPGEKLKTSCGSPCYAAPEMIAGKRYECLNADIWSCGIILYAMLCGCLPFEDQNHNKLYKKIMAGDFELPRFLSVDSKEIIKNILNVNPEARFTIGDIRESRWYRKVIPNRPQNKGIIVGKDPIQPNEKIIRKMEKLTIDAAQIRNYVINNRHNKFTAYYYLLLIKSDKDPKDTIQERTESTIKTEDTVKPRNESPVIYRPEQKKQYYVPQKKAKEPKDSSKNDSMNVSNIISSLVQANKNKLVYPNPNRFAKKNDANFDKMEEFKNFPKKKTTSIHDQSSAGKPALTNRSGGVDDKSFDFSRHSLPIEEPRATINAPPDTPRQSQIVTRNLASISINQPSNSVQLPSEQDGNLNKKRQELSDQLKQISIKIDKEILELRKQNTNIVNVSSTAQKKRDSLGSNIQALSSRNRTQESYSFNESKGQVYQTREQQKDKNQSLNQSFNQSLNQSLNQQAAQLNSRDKLSSYRQMTSGYRESMAKPSGPKIHTGPFNTQCIFIQGARSLMTRIMTYLAKINIKFMENDPYSLLLLQDNEKITVESVQGISGLHLVKFNTNNPLNESIIEILSK